METGAPFLNSTYCIQKALDKVLIKNSDVDPAHLIFETLKTKIKDPAHIFHCSLTAWTETWRKPATCDGCFCQTRFQISLCIKVQVFPKGFLRFSCRFDIFSISFSPFPAKCQSAKEAEANDDSEFWSKNVFLVENSISFKNACCVSKNISDLETGRLTVLTPCSKMREQVKLRAPSINTDEMEQKIIKKIPLIGIEHFIEKVLGI